MLDRDKSYVLCHATSTNDNSSIILLQYNSKHFWTMNQNKKIHVQI